MKKAKFNLNFYNGNDYYNEGDIEDEILSICKSHNNFDKILLKDSRWSILYHLSSIRENIINWYPFKKNSSCLEVGGGCGAITGALCKLINNITVVELSKRRSLINYERHKNNTNLEIIVGNLNDIQFDKKFDYITLIGVLEYAGSFTKTDNPYTDFLKKIRSFLTDDGKLLIAIENKYGLKYFAGAKEDHTAKEFDNITGYINNDNVRTFGKQELENILTNSGYKTLKFYYPHPDYKMPMEIYSDDFLPNKNNLLSNAPNFDNDRYQLFDETKAFKGIVENNQFEFFANSFLIECGV